MKICKKTKQQAWHYTEGWFCDLCQEDKPCKVQEE